MSRLLGKAKTLVTKYHMSRLFGMSKTLLTKYYMSADGLVLVRPVEHSSISYEHTVW